MKPDREARIRAIIEEGIEDDHCDFKRQHHSKFVDLLKDIICMANNVNCRDERYIIFGVDDDAKVVGINKGKGKKQADLVNALRDVPFAGNKPPISLERMDYDGKAIEVLTIEDSDRKPFFLIKDHDKLQAHVIYSRTKDSNGFADEPDIEKMWKQRFNLHLKPSERLEVCLKDFKGWKQTGTELDMLYEPQPEFSIEKVEVEDLIEKDNKVKSGESWVRLATNPEAYFFNFVCKYQQVELESGTVIAYDGARFVVPNPETKHIDLDVTNNFQDYTYFYSYVLDSFDGLLLKLFTGRTDDDYQQFPWITDRVSYVDKPIIPVIVFKNKNERSQFIEHVKSRQDLLQKMKYTPSIDRIHYKSLEEKDIEILKFSSRLMNLYLQWRQN